MLDRTPPGRRLLGRSAAAVALCLPLCVPLCLPLYWAPPGLALEPPVPAAPEAISLLGRPLARPELPEEFRARQETLLAEAQDRLAARPDDLDALIWVGRRTAYLGRYREAIETYTRGLAAHPDEPRLLRHRGHRWITVRELDRAIEDLARAGDRIENGEDRVEEDGLPNERGIPTSTLHTNVWYHLGLAHYLKGEFEPALEAYRKCLAAAGNPDMRVAASYWLYLTLARLDRGQEAQAILQPISTELDVIENADYYHLLLSYKNQVDAHELYAQALAEPQSVSAATVGYGIGAYHLVHGRPARARPLLDQAAASASWAAFGTLAAEAELARLREEAPPRP